MTVATQKDAAKGRHARHMLRIVSQVMLIAHAAAQGISISKSFSAMPASSSYTSVSSKTSMKPTYSLPSYPVAKDYAAGACAGYAFCFPNWNPPVVTEPDVMCPAGYDISSSNGTPICVQKQGVCPSGYDFSGKGDCCQVQTQNQCFADWDNCSGSDLSAHYNIGSICAGTNDYQSIVDNVQMVEVTSGSSWYDGSMDDSAAATWAGSDDDYSNWASSSSSSSSGEVYTSYPSSSSNDEFDGGTVQVIPSGNLVNLNGKLVHVGPVPTGPGMVPPAGSGTSGVPPGSGPPGVPGGSGTPGVTVNVNSTSNPAGSSPQQQAALAALQQQAIQQGTFIPGGSTTGSSIGGNPQLANQAAALAALQQQAQQQGTFIPGQQQQQQPTLPSTGTAASARYASKPYSSAASSSKYVSSSSGSGSRLAAGPLVKKLLLLPKIALGSLGVKISTEIVARKEIMASPVISKEQFLPKCFNKCCTSSSDIVCVDLKHTVNYAKPAYICPPGCKFVDNSNKCLCSVGHFTPCQPSDTVCSWGDRPICAGSSEYFGVEACTFVGLLQKQLPKVQCPY